MEINETDFRNYANNLFDIDTGTLSGLERYIEWIESLICDEKKLEQVKKKIKEQKEWWLSVKKK